ncbi:TPA: restriction endonuclease subunit S [Vibrio diabolicus]|uniref:restriction endonuclease subunit S n=1 Tax=Vibrio diabolicus TaxID=50719 RepID=UPI00215E4278|nr:restriction endonuclease subunit S [Vibrio diabolicus]MCS0341877.1 restriction endonuclease subunit S [Vibrio diabolicus]
MAVENLITEHIDIWTSAVKAKSTSGRGSSKKLELYGIKKLRELILELAVRGKLVPQDPNDEPASVLLERIAQEKAQLVKEKKIKKPKKLPNISDEEKPFDLPNGWKWVRFPDVAHYGPGKTPATKNSLYWDETGSGIPWVSIADLNDKSTVSVSTKKVSDIAVEQVFKRTPIPAGTMLMSFKLTVGKASILNVDAFHNEAIISVFPYTGVLQSYLFKVLPSRANSGNKKNAIMGFTLNAESLSLLTIPLPPEAEQHRIVAKVDELMTLCDQLEQQTETSIEAHQMLVTTLLDTLTNSANADELMQNWARISEHFDTLFTTEESIDQLKQTILQLAVMGKLVPQYSNDKVQTTDLDPVVKKHRKLLSLATNTGKIDLTSFESISKKVSFPDNWAVRPLAEVVLAVVDCPHSTPKWTDSGEICVRTTQMAPFKLDLSSSRYVSSDTYIKRVERLEPTEDDVLYSREGGILGIACRVPSGTKLCLGQRMIVIRPSTFITSKFLELVLNSPLINEIARYNTTGGAAPRVNVAVIKGYPIPLPALDEQNRIIDKAEELTEICNRLKVRLKESHTIQQDLTNAMVEQAV